MYITEMYFPAWFLLTTKGGGGIHYFDLISFLVISTVVSKYSL